MTEADKTLVAALLDRSGSMQAIADDMRGGFDAFIAKEAKEAGEAGTTLVTLAQFDDEYDVVYRNRPIKTVPKLTLEPRGWTALLDAIGRFVTEVGAALAALPEDERPGTVTVVVITDGLENASSEWTAEGVRAAIAHQETVYLWDFVFLGGLSRGEYGRRRGWADARLRPGQVADLRRSGRCRPRGLGRGIYLSRPPAVRRRSAAGVDSLR